MQLQCVRVYVCISIQGMRSWKYINFDVAYVNALRKVGANLRNFEARATLKRTLALCRFEVCITNKVLNARNQIVLNINFF